MSPRPAEIIRGPLAEAVALGSPKYGQQARVAAEVHALHKLLGRDETMRFLYHVAAMLARQEAS